MTSINRHYLLVWLGCITIFLVALLVNIGFGGGTMPLTQVVDTVIAKALDPSLRNLDADILFGIRFPRLAASAFAGAALAAAGVLSQGLFRNPLASPSIMGTTSGGAALAAIAYYLGAHQISWFLIPLAGFIGALLATFFLMTIVIRYVSWTTETLLLTGMALNTLFGAVTTLALSLILAEHLGPPAILHWLMGSIQPHSWTTLLSALILVSLAMGFAFMLAGQLDVLMLGEKVASTLSINVTWLRAACITTIALLVGTTVALAGPLPFVGLIVPHITRFLIGPHHKRLLILSAVNGMTLVLTADWVSRMVTYPRDTQVGILIAFIGAPFFLFLLIRSAQTRGSRYG